ncbi:MAG: hypothetical protein UY41_C0004G0006 [Candidatus Moranbacteria bacterium GW2011_GWE1_49_15]|nr:MAG: hypothetical protein UX75_C0005G0008 [Candidatus Moranbacteria bacterium GW2011_GWE2_47_10]KKW07389.1 MAG: hypothetical protein UY41_C0004G0006 [Candidatus Moranbacteria bacterium GW2011_GWE1_49_15]HBP00909.1 hypothetical protein [Candidatus Moranbacteria bacterium]
MEIGIKTRKDKGTNRATFVESLASFWNKGYKIIFALFLLAMIGAGAYVWYRSLYAPAWNDQEKATYRAMKDSGISFDEEAFSEAVKIVEERKSEYSQGQQESRDIFKKY